MPEDRTPDADELASTTAENGPGEANAIDGPRAASGNPGERPAAEPRSTASLHDAPRDTAGNEDDDTQGS